MVKAQNITAIEQATGISWSLWVEYLESQSAGEMPHSVIASLVHERLSDTMALQNPGWWAQGVAVAYEQHIGRRKPGQQSNGTFQVSTSKRVDGNREAVFGMIKSLFDAYYEHQGIAVTNKRESVTPVRSYWKCKLDDMNLTVAVESNGTKSLVTVTQTGCPDETTATHAKQYWKEFLQKIVQ